MYRITVDFSIMALKVTIRYQAAGTLCGIVSVTSPRSCDSWDESWHEPLADEWAKRSGARGAVRADGNSINQSRSWSSHPPSQTVSPQGASVLISNTSVISFSVCVCFLACLRSGVIGTWWKAVCLKESHPVVTRTLLSAVSVQRATWKKWMIEST